ncbi:nuclease-related domain-containing protein [Alkalihalobacillus pseudalcaliphilus]|uniref:nuclease-related domain-containing protein n=1 Tax=Alkalihalobacillus pseudalcaliphilus TaxID=79884 RepID=UPI00069F8F0B|nr:nuclease-related domain-containing protein [Alkalihalobacillus pseudalcaliphilus]
MHNFPKELENKMLILEKGYAGEIEFDKFTSNLPSEYIILNDLLLEFKGHKFQVDSLIITPTSIHLYEVKNYEGDVLYKNRKLYNLHSKKEIPNPAFQVERSNSLLRQLLAHYSLPHADLYSHIVFVNPTFYMYHAPFEDPSFIFHYQIAKHFQQIQVATHSESSQLSKIAMTLSNHQLLDYPTHSTPDYKFESLKKGIRCLYCDSFQLSLSKFELRCELCCYSEHVKSALKRMVTEFALLFPKEKLTTNLFYEWCNSYKSKDSLQRYLSKYHPISGKGKATQYLVAEQTDKEFN